MWARWACGVEKMTNAPSLKPPPPERFCCVNWGGMLHTGIIVASVYLHDGPSMSQQNKELLKEIADYLKLFGKPFVL